MSTIWIIIENIADGVFCKSSQQTLFMKHHVNWISIIKKYLIIEPVKVR